MTELDINDIYYKTFKIISEWMKAWDNKNGSGLTLMQILFLENLAAEGGKCKATDFVKTYNITAGGVTGITNKLLELGYVQKEGQTQDKRVSIIKFTNAGVNVLKEIRQNRTDMIKHISSGLDARTLHILNSNYEEIITRIKESGKKEKK